jgi:hypothetical protein
VNSPDSGFQEHGIRDCKHPNSATSVRYDERLLSQQRMGCKTPAITLKLLWYPETGQFAGAGHLIGMTSSKYFDRFCCDQKSHDGQKCLKRVKQELLGIV